MKNKRCVFKVCSLTFIPILPTPPPIQKSNASSKVRSQIKILKFIIRVCFEDVKEIPKFSKLKYDDDCIKWRRWFLEQLMQQYEDIFVDGVVIGEVVDVVA